MNASLLTLTTNIEMRLSSLFILPVLATIAFASSPRAEVLDSSAGGFVLEIEAKSNQPIEIVYQQFLKINEWWDGNHSWFGSAENFYIEPKVGGCFCEVSGDKQAQHMIVTFIEPNKEIRMLGGLGPLQMMGVNGAMSWAFSVDKSGATQITHRYTVAGYNKDGLDKLAPIVDSVQSSQVTRLVKKLEQSRE